MRRLAFFNIPIIIQRLVIFRIAYHRSKLFVDTNYSIVRLIIVIIGETLIIFRCRLDFNSILRYHTIA